MLEPLELPRVQGRRERQHLQRHPAAQRELLGLVDDPHAAPADLADAAGSRRDTSSRHPVRRPAEQPAGRLAQLGHHLDRRQQAAEIDAALGVAAIVQFEVHGFTGFQRAWPSSIHSARIGSSSDGTESGISTLT